MNKKLKDTITWLVIIIGIFAVVFFFGDIVSIIELLLTLSGVFFAIGTWFINSIAKTKNLDFVYRIELMFGLAMVLIIWTSLIISIVNIG